MSGTSTVAGQMPDVRTPTSNLGDVRVVIVFLTVPAAGIALKASGRFGSPPCRRRRRLPLEVLSELSRTFALSMRLFGNMLSGYLIVGLIVALVGLFVPMLMALDLLIGVLQAYTSC